MPDLTTNLTVDLGRAFEVLDLDRRLADAPESSTIRGLFFSPVLKAIRQAGPATEHSFRSQCRPSFRWPFRSYSFREYMRQLATAAALLRPEDPHEAIRRIWARVPEHAPLIDAEKYLHFLVGTNPGRAFQWLGSNRHLFCNYGSWRVEEVRPGYVIFHFWDEYLWIESAQRGGAEGSLRVFGARGEVVPELLTPYTGRLHIRWD